MVSGDLDHFLKTEKEQGKAVYGALLDGEDIFKKEDWSDGVIVIGSESHGIRSNISPLITNPITIPRAKSSMTESLNASMATGIILGFWASKS